MADDLNPSDVMDRIWLAAKQAHQSTSWYEACKLRLTAQHELNKLLYSRDAELARLRDEVERLRAEQIVIVNQPGVVFTEPRMTGDPD